VAGPAQGQITASPGQGEIAPGYAQLVGVSGPRQLMAGSGHRLLDRLRQGATINMVETDLVGMLASALDDMTYEDKA